jgi:hypothetical protein
MIRRASQRDRGDPARIDRVQLLERLHERLFVAKVRMPEEIEIEPAMSPRPLRARGSRNALREGMHNFVRSSPALPRTRYSGCERQKWLLNIRGSVSPIQFAL